MGVLTLLLGLDIINQIKVFVLSPPPHLHLKNTIFSHLRCIDKDSEKASI